MILFFLIDGFYPSFELKTQFLLQDPGLDLFIFFIFGGLFYEGYLIVFILKLLYFVIINRLQMQDNKDLASMFNFQKKKDLSFRKEGQIIRRCEESKGDSVNLSWLKINPADIAFIVGNYDTREKCENASELFLEFNQLNPKGVLQISRANWKNLRLLNLATNRISAKGIYYLTRGDWKHMQTLGLMANQIMDEGLLHLMKGKWQELTIINLSSNNISQRGLKKLVLGDWKNLVWIDLTLNRICEFGIAKLTLGEWSQLSNLPFSILWKDIAISRRQEKQKETFELILKSKFSQMEELQINFC